MKIGTVKDLEFVPIMGVVVDGKEIVILKTGKKNLRSGTGAPTWNACCPVGTISGRIEGETIRCTCHGSVFNIKTGEVVRGPAEKPEPVYTVSGENEELFMMYKFLFLLFYEGNSRVIDTFSRVKGREGE